MPELVIRAIGASDRAIWEPLWAGYLSFYEKTVTSQVTDALWTRLTTADGILGLLAIGANGEALGLVHFLYHPSASRPGGSCYIEDLFVIPASRGQRIGRQLIASVTEAARAAGAGVVYWQTEEFNGTARRLYERVAKRSPFIRYQIEL
jgi:GNAT superfamily N-acetyltransferase